MARMFPDAAKTRVIFASRAEERFYDECARQLPDDWRVYSSCTLSAVEHGQGLKDNEIDFVLYHPKLGLVVVEVKGGRVMYDVDRGAFFSINRHNQSFKIKNPFKQVLIWKSRFLRYLAREGVRAPVSHAVCFPNVVENEIPVSAEIEPLIVIGIQRLGQLEKALTDLATATHARRFFDFADVAPQIDRILRGAHFSTKLHLRDYVDNHELRLKDLESITETFVAPMASTNRLAVEGEAGTGKTMLAVMMARRFRDKGLKTLLLSSNALMNSLLKDDAGTGVDVRTYTELAASHGIVLLRKPKDFDGSAEDWTQIIGPERLKEAIAEHSERYDVLICDEGQDVQPLWWEALESLLRNDDARFYVFFDRSQGLFGSGGTDNAFVPEKVLPIEPPYFPLVHNYRTTREITGFSRRFRTGRRILQSHCGRLGYRPQVVLYKDPGGFAVQMKQLFRRLFEQEGIRTREVTILSARRPFSAGSTLKNRKAIGKYPLFDLSDSVKNGVMPSPRQLGGKVKVATISAFKGLETEVAIVVNLSEYRLPLDNPLMASLMYVACTRAKHMLYLFVQEDDPKRAVMEEALTEIRETGSLVLEGSSADYEFSGRVTHYNPDRVGWLRVDDPAFERDTIMFFPHDVEQAQLSGLKAGMELRFRPRLEGHVTIATDLRACRQSDASSQRPSPERG